jgi:hypothetical protein
MTTNRFSGYPGSAELRKLRWSEGETENVSFKQTLSTMWSTMLDASSIHGIKFLDRLVEKYSQKMILLI